MSWDNPDSIDRTAKILVDRGTVPDFAAAHRYLQQMVLQLAVGPEVEHDPAAQAALATAVNAGSRAYHGGVHVRVDTDPVLFTGWTAGTTASQLVTRYGGVITDELDGNKPTLVIGHPRYAITGSPILHLTWNGWSGGAVQSPEQALSESGNPVAGTLAAALGISEIFQQKLGAVVAGRRDVGVSLWRPDTDWRTADAGPPLQYLPAGLWLLGLGHLGQSYAWTIGMLPYSKPAEAHIGLLDFDAVVEGNTATQLLVGRDDIGQLKTRVVARSLENLGFTTRIVERAFDSNFRPAPHGSTQRNEPIVALTGFDDVVPRRALGDAGFGRVVDGGLGAGPDEYLGMLVRTFPAQTSAADVFAQGTTEVDPLRTAYQAEITRQVSAGKAADAARCGILDVAGITVGAAFVGTVASTLVIADILRVLHQGADYSVIALDMQNPNDLHAVHNEAPGSSTAVQYTSASMRLQ